jgi:hypothetical protein
VVHFGFTETASLENVISKGDSEPALLPAGEQP